MTKLLFICSRNRWRSPTAERLLEGVPGFAARSAGTAEGARVRVSAGLLGWADVVLCMEHRHLARLRERFGAEALTGKEVVVLDVPDDYGFMDPELVVLLTTALADAGVVLNSPP